MARVMILLAAAAAALLAAAPAAAQDTAAAGPVAPPAGGTLRPTPGALCGPNDDGIWVKPDKLAASGGGKVGADGCIAADKSATAFVRASLGNNTDYTMFEVYVAASSSSGAKRNATFYIGDVDLALWPKQTKQALKNQGVCASLPLGGETRLTCNAPRGAAAHYGGFVSVVGQGVRVCGLMLCVKEKLFSDRGEALTSRAAWLFEELLVQEGIKPASAAGWIPNGGWIPGGVKTPFPFVSGAAGSAAAEAAAALIGPAALPGSCAGYTSQSYGRCPDGKECASTYKPGDDVCYCGSCSAFTNKRTCEQGDTRIGSESCCFTCPDQPICAVCKTPCKDEVSSVEIIPGQMPTTPSSYTPTAGKLSSSTLGANYGANPQQVQVTFAFQQQMLSSMKFLKKNTYTEKATIKLGLPFFDDKGQLEFTAQQEMSEEKTTTTTRTVTVTYQLTQQIPPYTAQTVDASAELGILEVAIPVTVRTTYTCSGVKNEDNTITVQTQGVMNTASSKLSVTYGKQIPLDPPIVFEQADATCASNPLCRTMGLTTGNCCPNAAGTFNPCCSFCAAKPACAAYAVDNSTMCCPSRTNQLNACCGK